MVDVDTHQNTVFGVSQNHVCIATVAQGAEQAKFEVVRPNNISPGAKQKPHFTGIKVLPLHRLMLITCDDGRIRVCN
jgi:hypothetical protein